MSDATLQIERDKTTGRFIAGNSGNGGRRPGARNKLSEAFIADVHASWEKHGAEILERVAKEEPVAYLRALVALMPKDIRLDLALDPADFAGKFRQAVSLLHGELPELPRRSMKVISNGR